MTQPTRGELMERLAKAEAEREAVVMGLIVLELQELLTGLEASEDQAAAHLRETADALTGPLAVLASIEADIIAAEGKCNQWSALLSDETPPDKRARVRVFYEEWSREVTALKSRRDFAESGFQSAFEARDQARKVLTAVQAGKRAVVYAMLDPFGSSIAQGTQAYEAFRMPQLVPVLLANDRESPEWDKAVAELEELCLRSAYRTDHLPGEAEQMARAMTAAMTPPDAALAEAVAGPVPSAGELKVLDAVARESARLDEAREVVDDRRGAVPVRQPVQQRSYMEIPRLRDTGLR